MDGGAWWATVHGVAKSQTRLSDFTYSWTDYVRFTQDVAPAATTMWCDTFIDAIPYTCHTGICLEIALSLISDNKKKQKQFVIT